MDAKNFLRSIEREAIVAYTNKEGIIEYVNGNFCRISGYSKEELIGQDHRIINSGYHPKSFFQEVWSTILSGNVWVGDVCNRAKNGSIYWVNSTISPSIVDGEIVGFYAVRNDITRQKELEARNAELTRLSNEIQQVAHIGGWSYSLEDEQFMITAQVRSILGVPSNLEIKPQDIDELIPGNSINPFSSLFTKVLEEEVGIIEVFKMISLKGVVTWVKVTASIQKSPLGKPIKISGIFHDISDLKQAEEKTEMERRKSIHSAKLASIGEMSSSVVHEMNNPIASIQANMKTMQKLTDLNEIQSRLEKMELPVDKLIKLADNLRQYSRGYKTRSEQKVGKLKEMIEHALIFLEHRFNYSNVEVAVEVDEDIVIKCDISEMEQVFVNLLNNSVDAIERLKTRWIKIEAHRVKGKIRLNFIDSGEGIPKKVREHLFGPFYTTKSKEKGTGLGMGIVRDILNQHDATIRIDTANLNTKFVIEFDGH